MNAFRCSLAAALAAAVFPLSALAQADTGQCIVAGRLDGVQWAPRFTGVQLLGAQGKVVASADKKIVSGVRQVKLARPALLSRCDGDQPLFNADGEPAGKKEPVPRLAAGVFDVEAVAYPKLRTGGELVELRVRVPADKVTVSSR
ncbi:MAG: hypothetical protein JWQ76_3685 [Ramlibacter sp.]|nr:hypothetical protein [Ramlibacter sp.]